MLPADAANVIDSLIPKPPTAAAATTTYTYADPVVEEEPVAPIINYGQDDVMAQQVGERLCLWL